MARKTTARKLTRRDAVALMGAGTVMAAVRPGPAAATPKGQKSKPECNMPAIVSTLGRGTAEAIASYSCCDETRNAVLTGVGEPGKSATVQGKAHLAPLRNRLVNSNLLEYCFMIWGLKEEEAKTLFATVPQQFKFEPRDSPK
jgi:hypothetical protein